MTNDNYVDIELEDDDIEALEEELFLLTIEKIKKLVEGENK